MSEPLDNLNSALKFAMENRPKVGGFPFLAETLFQAGVVRNIWSLPSCQSIYVTSLGNVVTQLPPLLTGTHEIPKFDEEALVRALRTDQAGESTFPEFLKSTWNSGVVRYEVEFMKRRVTYYGALGESYSEDYPSVQVNQKSSR